MKGLIKLAAALACSIAFVASAWAVPDGTVYTGRLTASNGLPFDGDVEVGVIYFDAMDGAELGSETVGTTNVSSGVFRATLLELAGHAASGDNIWVEFWIDGAALLPRQKIWSNTFAHRAGDSESLGGVAAAEYIKGGDTVPNEALPTNGIGQVSNQVLNNEFFDVNASDDVAQDIADHPAPGIQSLVNTAETGDSYITSITVYTQFTLTLNSEIEMVLYPPSEFGLSPITLMDGSGLLTAGSYANSWSVGNTPALADLIGVQITGEWTLVLTDKDDTGGAGTIVGEFEKFEILYDVVRSDHLQVAGQLDVDGDMNVTGDLTAGAFYGDGSNLVGVNQPIIMWSGGCTSHGQSGGYNKYCLNGTDWTPNTDEYLSVDSSGDVTVLTPGYYRINAWAIAEGSGWRHVRFFVNGAQKHGGHDYNHGNWSDGGMDLTWRFNADDVFYLNYHNPASSAYHSWNTNGSHSRMQITYMGPLD